MSTLKKKECRNRDSGVHVRCNKEEEWMDDGGTI